jgi:hypothetical protein
LSSVTLRRRRLFDCLDDDALFLTKIARRPSWSVESARSTPNTKDDYVKTAELELLDSQIQVILAIQFQGLTDDRRKQLADSLAETRRRYEEAADKRDENKDDHDYYAAVCESIASGLPKVTQGALSAYTAFNEGDYFAGSAAIMDICAEVAPILGTFFTAGGPPGALFGALFSVVGQLLNFFGPKQPSLQAQINDMMLAVEAKAKLRTMLAVGDDIDVYVATLRKASNTLPFILKLPLQNEDDADKFAIRCGALDIGLELGHRRMGMSAFQNWEVLEWLGDKDRQDQEEWPEVLSAFCLSYTKLIVANVHFGCSPDRNEVYRLLKETQSSNKNSPLPPEVRADIHHLLIQLLAYSEAYCEDWKLYNRKVLELTTKLDEPARYRGLFLHIGSTSGYENLYAGSGQKNIVRSHNWHELQTTGGGNIKRMTTSLSSAAGSRNVYDCFLLRPSDDVGGIEYRTIRASDPPTSALPTSGTFSSTAPVGVRSIKSLPGLAESPHVSDLCALRGGGLHNEVWLYLASGKKIVELQLNDQRELRAPTWQSDEARLEVRRVRSVYAESWHDDPDGKIERESSASKTKVDTLLHYGALFQEPFCVEIVVIERKTNLHAPVPAPWHTFSGIEVDQHLLWVFGPGGFACATHASVMKAIKEQAAGKASEPRWMYYFPNTLLFRNGELVPLPGGGHDNNIPVDNVDAITGFRLPPFSGLMDLAPCEDGTVTLSLVTRDFEAWDLAGAHPVKDTGPCLYTAHYEIDPRAGTFKVDTWTNLNEGAHAQQIQKQPISCWSAFVNLKARLEDEGRPHFIR